MNFFLPLLYFLAITGTFVFIFKKKFGYLLPISFMITAFSLFFSQFIFHTFKIGFYMNLILALIFPFLFLYYFIKDKKNMQYYFTKGFYAFIILYLSVYLLDYYRTFSVWDEFSHWGVMVKEMFRLDKFYSVASSTLLVHKDYPPIIQIFELFWCKLCGHYEERFVIKALHLFNFALLLPIFEKKSKTLYSFIIHTILTFIIAYLIILLFDGHGVINAIYTDYTLSMLVCFGMFMIFQNEDPFSNFILIILSFVGSTLVLTKQMGLPLYFMIIFCYIFKIILNECIKQKFIWKKEYLSWMIKGIILLFLIPFGLWFIWNHYIDSLGIVGQFELSDLHLSTLPGIIKGTSGEKWQNKAYQNFMKALFDHNIVEGILSLSYIQLLFIGYVLLKVIFILCKNLKKRDYINILITLSLGTIGYTFTMLVLYVYSFGPREGPTLASFDRYMPTYILIIFMFIFMIYLYFREEKREKINHLSILLIILFLCLNTETFQKIYPKFTKDEPNGYEYQGNIIRSKVEYGAKVFIVAQNSSGNYQFFLKYYAGPIITNLKYYHWPIQNEKQYGMDEVFEELKQYDYLYLASITDEFISKYYYLFPDGVVEGNKVYKISSFDGNITLDRID